MMIRIGIPASFPRFSTVASDLGAPILVSANAFWGNGCFRFPRMESFRGLDLALDSAGFVAMFRYLNYQWALDQYVALVAHMRPTWWAAPDYCCEPEIASDRAEVIERVTRTAFKLDWARQVAVDQDVRPPMPVLQGWFPEDYVRCADLTPDLPNLVGVGSVCRRSLSGDAGVLLVLAVLDRVLPPHVKLHLFGVKGAAVAALAGHPRIHSVDSQAWDFAARRGRHREGVASCTVAYRSDHMRRWYLSQRDALGLWR